MYLNISVTVAKQKYSGNKSGLAEIDLQIPETAELSTLDLAHEIIGKISLNSLVDAATADLATKEANNFKAEE